MKKSEYVLFFVLLLFACNKEEKTSGDPTQELIFQSLASEKDTILSGESAKITAVATGYMLSYYWDATAGDILGSGSQITYVASPCQIGTNQITCKVKDGNNMSKSKTIDIVVQ